MSQYVVIYERAEDGGWGAYLPDLPGVVALGSSREEVASRIREAVDAYAREQAGWADLCRIRSRPRERSKRPDGRLRRLLLAFIVKQGPRERGARVLRSREAIARAEV